MKVVCLGIILIFLLVTMSYAKPIYAESNDPVQILNVQVQPNTIKVNDTFSLNMVILNNSTFPIYLTSGSCAPAFSVVFDAHVKQVYPNIACTAEAILQKVDPQSQAIVSNVNKPGVIYQAVQTGTANANITLPYYTKNQTATDYSNIYYNASKSFQFQIYYTTEPKIEKSVSRGTPVKPTLDLPLKQFKSGIKTEDVKCTDGFTLVIKSEDGSPACVKPDTSKILIERGWTESITSGISQTSRTSNQTVEIVSIQSVPSLTNPGGPPIQLTLRNIGTTPITSLKALLTLNNDYNFDFENVTQANPLASGDSISETRILIGAGFRTDIVHPITISGITNNIPFTYTENIHMP